MQRALRHGTAIAGLAVFLAACSTTPPPENTVLIPPNAGVYKVGNPYQIQGTWYYPHEQPEYDETGIASWYGPNFHGGRTANGEIFDENALTAAHRTLPMPVNVRVTKSGKRQIYYSARVNDLVGLMPKAASSTFRRRPRNCSVSGGRAPRKCA